jgi:hypothetical protein
VASIPYPNEPAEAFEGEVVGEAQPFYIGGQKPIRRFEPLTIKKAGTGAIEAMPHWAGESVNGVKEVQPAADIMRELVDEAERLLQRWL